MSQIKSLEERIKKRSILLGNMENILESIVARRESKKNQSDDLFGSLGDVETATTTLKSDVEILSPFEILTQEKNSLGLYVSGNPLAEYKPLEGYVRDVLATDDIHLVLVEKIKKIFTKKNQMMLAFQLTTTSQNVEGLVFPKNALRISPLVEEKEVYWLVGKLSQKKKKETETGSDEVKEYDELPKLLIDELCGFKDGVLSIVRSSGHEVSDQRANIIKTINWQQVFDNPTSFTKKLTNSANSQKPEKSADIKDSHQLKIQSSTQPKEIKTVRLPKSLSFDKVKEIKSWLSKNPLSDGYELKLQVETPSGEIKSVKGTFWVEADKISILSIYYV